MNNFLEEFIFSLSGRRQERIFDVLSAARVTKEDLDSLAEKLADIRKSAPIVISPETYGSLISVSKFDGIHRDVYRRTQDLYQASNTISLLLDSHSDILTSEIKALEDELLALEKTIKNYAFTLSDKGAYDFSFTETFNDDTMLEDSVEIKLTDRSGVDFASEERAVINSSSGTLTLSPTLNISYPIFGDITKSNCLDYSTSDTGLGYSLNQSVRNGWRVAISTPRPISSSLEGTTKRGAQIEIAITLNSSSPCDTIVLTPFSDIAVEILSIKISNEAKKDAETISVLNNTITLDKPYTVNFPLQTVAKFYILINQSVYTRGSVPPVQEEVDYRRFNESIKIEQDRVALYMGKRYSKNKKALKRVFIKALKKSSTINLFKAEIPQIDFEAQHGPLTIDRLMTKNSDQYNNSGFWNYKSTANILMRRMIDEAIFGSNEEMRGSRYVYHTQTPFSARLTSLQASLNSGRTIYIPENITTVNRKPDSNILSGGIANESQFLNYQYNLGLRNIEIGSGDRIFRGIFVMKQIPAPSDSGEVKIKVDDINFSILDTSRDSRTITSTEYSVSNRSTPKLEEDWIPILPIGASQVIAERLYLDGAGYGGFRFPTATNTGVSLFRNGFAVDRDSITMVRFNNQQYYSGLRLPFNSYSPSDVFTVDYFPYGDQSVVNFADRGFGQSSLASAYDDNGAGETFSSTFNSQMITLAHEPFISYDLVNTHGVYSSTLGFTGSYQPITIVMSDGSVALNQTNYIGNAQNNLSSFPETTTAFLHSGKNIIFNKPITSSFTVYYQFLPSNLRVRAILRVNDINYVSPIINSIQLKTKTLKANPRKAL